MCQIILTFFLMERNIENNLKNVYKKIIHSKLLWYEKNVKATSLTYGKGRKTKITLFQIHPRVYIFLKLPRKACTCTNNYVNSRRSSCQKLWYLNTWNFNSEIFRKIPNRRGNNDAYKLLCWAWFEKKSTFVKGSRVDYISGINVSPHVNFIKQN